MKSSVNEATAKNCPTCSRPLPSGAPAGLCPACLLAQGAVTESGAGAPRDRFVPPPLAEIAALFPQLEVLRLLGAGGMGAVYQARQPALDRFVALKVLPAETDGGANFSERFNREARALARLNHPNIVTVHEFGQAGRLHYFLMEFVDGANLRQLEQASRLSPREALQLIPQICDALQYAHDEGVVHRDIKPENVLVDRKGRVKIADFGLAKILGHDPETARLTVEGQVMGTPHYMAPEQVERPLAVDHRADIYSLGVVFYEMLTGDLPLGKFAPPSRKVQVDVRLDEIVLRALENDPARRYQQASEVKSGVATVVETPTAAKLSTPTTAQADEDSPKPGVRYLRWLGIPAVVERDGGREVNFQGALGVFFMMLMASALMQQAVRWVTGTEYATTQLGFVTAAMMAIWAIRRTMNQPWGDEPPRRAANGTVILLPTKRRRYVGDGLMVVALLAFVVGSHYLKNRVINPRLGVEQNASPAHQPATLDPETGVLAVKLPGGGTLELLALAPQETLPNGWWRPDGRPLTGSTVVVSGLNPVEPARGKTYFDFVFRADGLPAGAEVAQFSVGGGSTIRGGTVLMDGKTPPGAIRVRADLAKTAGLASFEIGLGLEPWQTLARHDPKKQANIRFRQAGDPAWDISLAHRAGTNGLAEITGTYGPGQSGWQVRIVALDHDGVAHTDVTSLSKIGPEALASTWTFRALPLTEVAEFQLQARRLHWVDFRAVAPNPKVPLPRGESLRLAEPIERTFDELIDFDTGRTVAFPVAIPGDNPFTSIGENILWAQENGFDAVAGRGELQVADADFAPLSNADWDTLTAEEVINRLHQGTFHPRTLKELRPGEFPATYAYRTREQGYGMIQLVVFDPERPGATVRLKRVVRPGARPTPAETRTASLYFGALERRVFSDLLDFDTGGLATYKSGPTYQAGQGGNLFEGLADTVGWMRQNGFDAKAGTDQLHLVDMEVVPLENGDWDSLTASDLVDRFNQRLSRPQFLKPAPGAQLPVTFGFRTRERGIGILQLVAFHPRESKATVSYKLLLGAGARPPAAPPVAALELRPVVPPGDTESHFELLTTADGQRLRVAKNPWLRADAFTGASWRIDPVSNARVIVLRLSDSGRREFARLSAEHVREQIALVLAGRILFAPQIAAPMDVATLEVSGLDRERGEFVELLAALNPRPAAGPIRFGEEHEAVLLKGGGPKFHWWNLAEARALTVAGTDRSSREYHEARGGAGGDLEALGDNPVPVVSGHELTVVPLASDGPSPTALEVAYRWELLHQEPERENLLTTGTYALRTRSGFTGILEVLGWAENQTGIRIRYREVIPASPPMDFGSPPQLRMLAWQAGSAPGGAAGTWKPDGTSVPLDDLKVMRRLSVGLIGMERPDTAIREHYLHVCVSHPAFDRHSLVGLELIDESGRAVASRGGDRASAFTAATQAQNADAWWAITLNPGAGDQVPKAVNLRLRYAVGPLEQVQFVPAKSWEAAALNGWLLSGVGEEDRRRTYLALSGDDEQDQTSGVQAVLKDGRTMDAESVRINSSPSARRRRFIFAAPLAEVLEFRVGRRAIRTVDWTNVVLLPGKPSALPMPHE